MRKRKTSPSSTTTEALPATPVALGLGSNLDDPERQLRVGLQHLAGLLDEIRVAPLIHSRPESPIDQPDYVNSAVVGTCQLSPEALLGEIKRIEYLAGRRRVERWGPRVLDIDLLLWDQTVCRRPELTLPHPRLREREFVLAPLARIAPTWRVPPDGKTVSELLADLAPNTALEMTEWARDPLL